MMVDREPLITETDPDSEVRTMTGVITQAARHMTARLTTAIPMTAQTIGVQVRATRAAPHIPAQTMTTQPLEARVQATQAARHITAQLMIGQSMTVRPLEVQVKTTRGP